MPNPQKQPAVAATTKPQALRNAPEPRKAWYSAADRKRVNGWSIVTSQAHRISAIKGDDLVHFAPQGSDFDSPSPLSETVKNECLQVAMGWCKRNACIATEETAMASISQQIQETIVAVAKARREVLSTESLDAKLAAHQRMKDHQTRLAQQRLKFYAAEDAIHECITSRSLEPFDEMQSLYPATVEILRACLLEMQFVESEAYPA